MKLSDRNYRETESQTLRKIVENPDFRVPADVEEYYVALTKYIWDHKNIGSIYDSYLDDTILHGENGHVTDDVLSVFRHTSDRLVTIPDLETTFLEIHAKKVNEDEFRFVQVTHLDATFTGPCSYGPAGDQVMNYDNNMSICECQVKKVDGEWKIVEEWGLGFDDFFKVRFPQTQA